METELLNMLSINTTIIASIVSIAAVSICSVISAFITQHGVKKAKQAELLLQEMTTAYYDLLRLGGEFSDINNQNQISEFTDAYTRALLFASTKTQSLIYAYRDSITKISALKLDPPPDFLDLVLKHEQLANDLIQSMLAQYEQYGLLPVWPLWSSETNCMIGYHAVPVIVDAYFKGIRNYDVEKAYQAMKTSAMQDNFGVKELKQYGYIPYDVYNKSVSTALEYCYDDWCIAQMAKDLGKIDDYNYFMRRSSGYRTYFDKEYKLMNGFSSQGSFRRPFDPFFSSYGECDWVEGNSWQYSFFVPHDVQGLINLYGGSEEFASALDTLFSMPVGMSGHDVPIDITGLIGQYAHGNEPSHHVAYLYNYAGQPHKAQQRLHEIMSTLYTDQPDGLCGNEDCGQMSAWYVFSAMGFYPVNPAEGIYILGKPMVEKAEISIGDKPFKVKTVGWSDENIYVQSVKLNGRAYNKLFITHADIVNGGTLEFTMSPVPGNFKHAILPPSISETLNE